MPSVDVSPCPACSAPPGSLELTETLVAAPVGTFSLAGVMMKFSARTHPVLTCHACDLRVVGTYDGDGRHVSFTPPTDQSAAAAD